MRISDWSSDVCSSDLGFINMRLADQSWRDELGLIHAAGSDYGRSTMGQGRRVNVEYVSANPTGPMHVGHCRGAVVGDALAALLEYAGHRVTREYNVNDRSEEHTSELQSLMRNSYAVFCLKKKNSKNKT